MPLPRGHSLNSSVIQDAPAVMPFTMQAAPATLGFSAKLVTTNPQSLPALPRALRLLRQRRPVRPQALVRTTHYNYLPIIVTIIPTTTTITIRTSTSTGISTRYELRSPKYYWADWDVSALLRVGASIPQLPFHTVRLHSQARLSKESKAAYRIEANLPPASGS